MKQRRGQIAELVSVIIFLIVLLTAVLPTVSQAIDTNSSSMASGLPVVILIPLFLAIVGLIVIVSTMTQGNRGAY